MAKENELINMLEDKFNSLTIDELDRLKEAFQDFYLSKEYDLHLKPEINKELSSHLVCPHCGSTHVVKDGKDQFGDQRYKCKNDKCKKKTFTLKTNTLTYYSKKNKAQWLLFLECLFNKETIVTTCDKVGICENTALTWRHKTMYLIDKMLEYNKLEGLTEIDETFFLNSIKGLESMEDKSTKKRGISEDKIGVACALDEGGHTIIRVINPGRPTSQSLINVFKGYIDHTNTVVSDSLRSYHKLNKELQYKWIKIPSGKKSINGFTLDAINTLHGNLKMYIGRYRGVSANYLQGYLALYELLSRYPRYYQPVSFRSIAKAILKMRSQYRGMDFTPDFSFD